ncbi:hypothetical protein BGW80DRAFT_1309751, partial [Lactifluus volemus]
FVLLLIPFATCPPLTAITFAQKKLEKHVQDIFMYDESIWDTSVKADPSESERAPLHPRNSGPWQGMQGGSTASWDVGGKTPNIRLRRNLDNVDAVRLRVELQRLRDARWRKARWARIPSPWERVITMKT